MNCITTIASIHLSILSRFHIEQSIIDFFAFYVHCVHLCY